MALSKKLKNAMKSSPSTKPLITYLEGIDSLVTNAVDNDTIYDDSNVWTAMGISKDTDFSDENFTPLSERVPTIDKTIIAPIVEEIVDDLLAEQDVPQGEPHE